MHQYHDGSEYQMSYSLFDVLDNITTTKDRSLILSDPDYLKAYNPFGINRALMQSPTSIMIAAEVNKRVIVDKVWHQNFLISSIKKAPRRAKWVKKEDKDEFLPFVMKQYAVSEKKALGMLTILTNDELEAIKHSQREGGDSKRTKGKKN